MDWPAFLRRENRALRFCALFAVYLAVLAAGFEYGQALWARAYMWPVSAAATSIMCALGLEAVLDVSALDLGYCELAVRQIVYRVTFDCTGVFALLVYGALVAAYPASGRLRVEALLTGVPAVAVFSCLRLVVLGVVAQVEPAWIELFHVYVMELATIGVMLYVWKHWVNRVGHAT